MATETTETLRARYKNALVGLTYGNASPAQVKARLADLLRGEPTPEEWVRAIESVRMPCRRCASTGRFVTMVENGQPKGPGGSCYRCSGNGVQNYQDGHRNRTFDQHMFARAAHAMMAEGARDDD